MRRIKISEPLKAWLFRVNAILVVLIILLWSLGKIDSWLPMTAIPGFIGAIAYVSAELMAQRSSRGRTFSWEIQNFLFGAALLGFVFEWILALMFVMAILLENDPVETGELAEVGLSWEYILFGIVMVILGWYSMLFAQLRRKLVQ